MNVTLPYETQKEHISKNDEPKEENKVYWASEKFKLPSFKNPV